MREVIDQMGRCVWVPDESKRIISLVPSQTELLFDLGVKNKLVGLTKFCVHPKGLKKEKIIIAGTKTYKLDRIRSLKPDLIIGNKEENDQTGIEQLAEEFPVWMSDISNLAQALQMINEVGVLVNKVTEAQKITRSISKSFENLRSNASEKVIYLIWHDPIMVAGKGTFIDDMLDRCNFQNLIDDKRYPTLSVDDLKVLSPDRILLSSEPFPFKEKHIKGYQSLCPKSKIELVDGEIFSWYGTRLLQAPDYFQHIKEKGGPSSLPV